MHHARETAASRWLPAQRSFHHLAGLAVDSQPLSSPPVLEIQVVGMLPDIHGQDGGLALHHRGNSIGGLLNAELAGLISYQPGPAGAKLCGTCTAQHAGQSGQAKGQGGCSGQPTALHETRVHRLLLPISPLRFTVRYLTSSLHCPLPTIMTAAHMAELVNFAQPVWWPLPTRFVARWP